MYVIIKSLMNHNDDYLLEPKGRYDHVVMGIAHRLGIPEMAKTTNPSSTQVAKSIGKIHSLKKLIFASLTS